MLLCLRPIENTVNIINFVVISMLASDCINIMHDGCTWLTGFRFEMLRHFNTNNMVFTAGSALAYTKSPVVRDCYSFYHHDLI